ncbi:hypothetical protein Tco_1360194 [Tanacetum coccineum]
MDCQLGIPMWGWGLVIVMVLEGCGEVNEVDKDRMWGLGFGGKCVCVIKHIPEPKKKSKKEIEQERLSFAEAIRLEEQMNEEQRAQIARDEEIAETVW